jgi:translation initiation factor IF-3
MKELQLTPSIDAHDFAVKLNHAIGFLCEDMKVRIKLRFRGRQKAHKEFGFEVVNRFVKATAAFGHADSPPKMAGDRDLNVIISPLPRAQRAPNPQAVQTPGAQPSGVQTSEVQAPKAEPTSSPESAPTPST